MDLKFYLNKFARIDGIEGYTLKSVLDLKKCYDKFIEKTEGFDPDFPETDFSGGKKGKKIGGVNKTKVDEFYGKESDDLGSIFIEKSNEAFEQGRREPGNGQMRNPNRGRNLKRK